MCFDFSTSDPETEMALEQQKREENERVREEKEKLLAQRELEQSGLGVRSLISSNATGFGSNYSA